MEDHDDFAFEPIPGLPEKLPRGEALLWQGAPDWRALAISAFHVRKIAAYFGIVLAWQLASRMGGEAFSAAMLGDLVWLVVAGAAAIGILCLLAFLYARGTVYTLTTKRIVIRSGLALPVTLNLPLALVDTAAVGRSANATANIAITITKPNRIAYLVLWPNVRRWTISNPQPLLRCLTDADAAVALLGKALRTEAGALGTATPPRIAIAAGGQSAAAAGQTIAA